MAFDEIPDPHFSEQECAGCGESIWWDRERPVVCDSCRAAKVLPLRAAVVALATEIDSRHDADCSKYEDRFHETPWAQVPCSCGVGPVLDLPVVAALMIGQR